MKDDSVDPAQPAVLPVAGDLVESAAHLAALQQAHAALDGLEEAHYDLTLFVSGASSSSARAIRHAQAMCEEHLEGRYDLTIVDVNDHPQLACDRRVRATPTLLRGLPAPARMLVGDLSDHQRVLRVLDVHLDGSPGAGGHE